MHWLICFVMKLELIITITADWINYNKYCYMYFDSYMYSSLFNLRVVTFFLNFLLPMQHLPILITLSVS